MNSPITPGRAQRIAAKHLRDGIEFAQGPWNLERGISGLRGDHRHDPAAGRADTPRTGFPRHMR
jgi:hypothetical protein